MPTVNSPVVDTVSVGWRITPGFDLCWREWDGECIVYHTGTADTHYIDAVGVVILKFLEKGNATVDDVVSHLSSHFLDTEDVEAKDLESTVARHLDSYQILGLIEQFSPA